MKKLAFKKSRLTFCLCGALLSGFIVLLPVICVKQDMNQLLSSWPEFAFYALAILAGGAAGANAFASSRGARTSFREFSTLWAGPLFVFLYVALCVLCQRMNLTPLTGKLWPIIGVILVAAGFSLFAWSLNHLGQAKEGTAGLELPRTGPYKIIRHPDYLSLLVCATGLPLIFEAWLPLLALPGTFVALKWRIADEEEKLQGKISEEFAEYKKATWRLLPPLF